MDWDAAQSNYQRLRLIVVEIVTSIVPIQARLTRSVSEYQFQLSENNCILKEVYVKHVR